MAAPVTDPAIAPAERVPLSDSFDDDELVNVDVGVHVEHGAGVVAALSDAVFPATDDGDSVERGASETATYASRPNRPFSREREKEQEEGMKMKTKKKLQVMQSYSSESPQSKLSADFVCNTTPTTTQIPPGGMFQSHTYLCKYK
ncbi:hypothetical protein E4U25_008011 [Claviceps purpurea]|nr:hypothetical protein E4U25_008011 [Claviceps purpurea]